MAANLLFLLDFLQRQNFIMKILLITPYFSPEVGSAAHLYYESGLALWDRGHEISILTGLPRYHVAGKQKDYRQRPWHLRNLSRSECTAGLQPGNSLEHSNSAGNGPICFSLFHGINRCLFASLRCGHDLLASATNGFGCLDILPIARPPLVVAFSRFRR